MMKKRSFQVKGAPEGTKHMNFGFQFKEVTEDGMIRGYGSIFGNVDLGGDIVAKGAFRKTIRENNRGKDLPSRIKMLWQHNSREPIGVWTLIKEDEKGLYMEGQLNLEVQRAKEAMALIKQGAIEGLSIGYAVVKENFDRANNIRTLKELKLREVSVVTFPMNPEANASAIKQEAFDDIEDALYDAGLDEKECKQTLEFIKSLREEEPPEHSNSPEAGVQDDEPQKSEDLGELLHSINNFTNQLKGESNET